MTFSKEGSSPLFHWCWPQWHSRARKVWKIYCLKVTSIYGIHNY